MRLRSTSVKGLRKRYVTPDPTTLDLDALGGPLIALVGRKGSGKTTLAESIPASLFKSFPTRADFYDCFEGRDAYLESVWEDEAGQEIRCRLKINAERRTMESYIDVNGSPAKTADGAEVNGKDKPFREWIAEHFGSERSSLASVFGCQKKTGSLIRMTKGDRKATLGEWIGTGPIQALSEESGKRALAVSNELGLERSKLASRVEELAALPELEEKLTLADQRLKDAGSLVFSAQEAERAAIADVERAKGAEERIESLRQAEDTTSEVLSTAEEALRKAKAEPEGIEARHTEKLRFIEGQVRHAETAPIYDAHAEAVKILDTRRERLETQLASVPDADATWEELDRVREETGVLEKEDENARDLKRDYTAAEAEERAAITAHTTAREARLKEHDRLKAQASLIGEVPCAVVPVWFGYPPAAYDSPENEPDDLEADLAGTCPLLANAHKAEEARAGIDLMAELPEQARVDAAQKEGLRPSRLINAEEKVGPDRKTRHATLKLRSEQLTGDLARAEAAPQLRVDLADVIDERRKVDQKLERDLGTARKAAEIAEKQKREVEEQLAQDIGHAEIELQGAVSILEKAEARHAAAADTLEKALADVVDLDKATCRLAEARGNREDAESALRDADQAVTRLRTQVDALREKDTTLEGQRQGIHALETQLGDLRFLEKALGRDGVQALILSEAGPEIAETANELLRSAAPEFSISFETLRAYKTKGREDEEQEVFDIKVYHDGQEQDIDSVSGGEEAIIDEAIRLSAAIHCARKSGTPWKLIVRDEPTGSLDPESAAMYPPMLRRAMELGGFEKCIFISHQPDAYEQADVQVHVDDGQLSVVTRKEAA